MAERSPAETVRARVAEADRLRRLRDESVRVWRVAPPAAAMCLGLAAASRWAGWPAVVPFAALAVGAAVLGLMLFLVRRDREVSDATAAALDEGAALGGELRSAHWFARRDDGDPWIEFHLARAAERVQSVDWKRLYSPPPSARARIATVAMAAAALAIVLVGSRGAIAAARRTVPGSLVDVRVAGRPLPELPPELRKKLEDLLNAIETGHAGSLTGAE